MMFGLPNKRLKLAGGDRFKGSGVFCPWRGTDGRPTLLPALGSGGQLKRDPLGGAAVLTFEPYTTR